MTLDALTVFLRSDLMVNWIYPLLAAFVHSMIIGAERERQGQAAGMRTFALTGCFSTFITLLSVHAFREINPAADPMRLAAQLLPGVGFIGAGAVWREIRDGGPGRIHGLTTGSALLSTVAMGIGYAARIYIPTLVFGTLCFLGLTAAHRLLPRRFNRQWQAAAKGEAGSGDDVD